MVAWHPWCSNNKPGGGTDHVATCDAIITGSQGNNDLLLTKPEVIREIQ